jgi:hypothetical protein
MSDLNSTNRNLIIKRHEHARLVALSNVHAREIRIIELEEEIERNKVDIIPQRNVIAEAEANIKQQQAIIEESAKKAAAAKAAAEAANNKEA